MRLRLTRRAETAATVTLGAATDLPAGPLRLTYHSRTGALLRIDGIARGAFDDKHTTIVLPAQPGACEITLEVELRSLPISGLPAGNGPAWWWMQAREAQSPATTLTIEPAGVEQSGTLRPRVPLIGHSHLDLAWLWRYDQTKRKALRTYATALRQLEHDERFMFAASTPQEYSWARAADPELFARIRARVADGRWDASIASMWVEPDLHAPSGESILRQFAFGLRWTQTNLDVRADVAWLPDTFGFPSTFPTLAAHAGVPYFISTKLMWNEQTKWPYPQFIWIGDDGSRLTSAMVAEYDGEVDRKRLRLAEQRHELLIHGFGDGGGGVTDEQIAAVAPESAPWRKPSVWLAERAAATPLPEYRGELYLETHRGTYTTHRDVKERNAALERALDHAEELAAWCVAVRAPEPVLRSFSEDLQSAWRVALRAQFHDTMAGSALAGVYEDVIAEFDRAFATVARVVEGTRGVLPRSDVQRGTGRTVTPQRDGDTWLLENDFVRARVRDDGTVVELAGGDGVNLVSVANGIAAYRDRPKRYDAWNLDISYAGHQEPVKPGAASMEDDAVVAHLEIGRRSRMTTRISLAPDEPWLRIESAVAWHEDHVLLRAEHRFVINAREVRFGQPHGTLVRTAFPKTAEDKARFEVPGQRWAHVTDDEHGVAVFVSDLYGWSAVGLKTGGVRLGTSLLRSPTWPDPTADRGEQRLAYALVPTAGASISALEHAWHQYAREDRVRLFTTEDDSVLVVATYPSADANGVIVRVRECDGAARRVELRSGGRVKDAVSVDAAERSLADPVSIIEEALVFDLPAYGLRAFLVQF